jgi:hypothetical protein
VAPYFALVAFAAFIFGTVDLLAGGDIPARVVGGLFLAGSLILCAGVWALAIARHGQRYAVAFVAAVTAIALSGYVLLATLTAPDARDTGLIAGFATLLGALGSAAILWRRGGLAVRDLVTKSGGRAPRTLLSFVFGGTLIGLGQFWYTDVYRPESAVPTVKATVAMKEKARSGGMVAVEVSVDVENGGPRALNVLGSLYQVALVEPEPNRHGADTDVRREARILRSVAYDEPSHRFARVGPGRVVESGTPVPYAYALEPGEEYSRRFVVYIPEAGRLRVLRTTLYFVVSRRKFRGLEVKPAEVADRGRAVYRVASLGEGSALELITRKRRHLHVIERRTATRPRIGRKAVPTPECFLYPALTAYIDHDERVVPPPGGECGPDAAELADHQGLASTHSTTEVVVKPGARD